MSDKTVRYKITIQKITDVDFIKKNWHELWSDEVFRTEILPAKKKAGEDYPSQNGYVEVTATEEERVEIFTQTITHGFDMMAVITAFNATK